MLFQRTKSQSSLLQQAVAPIVLGTDGQAAIDAAPDRTIWGTDWPHGNTFEPGRVPNDGDLLDLIAEMPHQALDRPSGRIAMGTNRMAFDLVADR